MIALDLKSKKDYVSSSEIWKDFLVGFFAPWVVSAILSLIGLVIYAPKLMILIMVLVIYALAMVFFFKRRRFIFYGLLAELIVLIIAAPIVIIIALSEGFRF